MKNSLVKKWILCLIPLFLAAIMYFVLPFFPKFTEYVITRGIFRWVAFPLEYIVSFIPFSVTETVVILAVPVIIALVTVFVIRLFKKGHPLKTAERGVRFLAFFLSMFLFVFMLTDGGNFSRIPLGELMELPNRQYTKEELYTVTCDLAKKATATREKLPEDENGYVKLSVEKKEILRLADDVYENLQNKYPFLITGTAKVKSVVHSRAWSYTGTTGVYCPWTLEANVNTDVPDSDLGHTAAHEIAHTMGFAKEIECNFLGWLACATSQQPDYEYSGHLAAFIYCSNALYKADKELWAQAYKDCSKGIIDDLKQRNEYWQAFEGEVLESSQKVNDTFIKANGVESGTLSYNQMVELMLRYYDLKGYF